MMELNYSVLFAVSAATIIIGLILHQRVQAGPERLYLWAFLCGMYIICGFGSAYVDVPHSYALTYLIYVIAAGTGFAVVVNIFRVAGARTCRRIDWRLSRIDATQVCAIGFWVYLVSLSFPLFYPTIRLNLLWNPPAPDLLGVLNNGIVPEETIALRLIGYVILLCYPVYLWRLRAYSTRPLRLALAVFGPLYISYCGGGYASRGGVLLGIAMYMMLLWRYRYRARKYIVMTLVAVTPLALIGSAEYATVRLGRSLSGGNVLDEVSGLVATETGLPLNAAVVLESGKRVNLGDLALWAVTLPLPKILTGSIVTFQPNTDMAELITNIPQGEGGFSFSLTGIVGESVYFGGPWFYWFPAVLAGGMFGLLCTLCSRSSQLGGVTVYCVLLWAYVFSRAGLDGGIPMIVNGLLPFFAVVVFLSRRKTANRAHKDMSTPNARPLVPAHDALQE
jgi:hypothetical protein